MKLWSENLRIWCTFLSAPLLTNPAQHSLSQHTTRKRHSHKERVETVNVLVDLSPLRSTLLLGFLQRKVWTHPKSSGDWLKQFQELECQDYVGSRGSGLCGGSRLCRVNNNRRFQQLHQGDRLLMVIELTNDVVIRHSNRRDRVQESVYQINKIKQTSRL